MGFIEDFINVSYLGLLSSVSKQQAPRIPEPDLVTTKQEAVQDYDRAMDSSLTLLYAIDIQMLKLILKNMKKELSALDLGCGPGILTSWMAKYLNISAICGLDLSVPMLRSSTRRFENLKLSCQYDFKQQNITDLSLFSDGLFDLVTCMDATHHLPTLAEVTLMLKEAERVCKPDGIIFISDIVRPKTERIFKFYYKMISKKNELLHMHAHNQDFFNSLRAAWTCEELASCVPAESEKNWYQVFPFGFQYMQILIGLPKNSPTLSLKEFENKSVKCLIPQHLWPIWKVTTLSFKYGSRIKKI